MTDVVNPSPAPAVAAKNQRFRRIGVAVLAVLAVLGILASTLALWTKSTLFSSSRFEVAVRETLANPAVTDAIAIYVTDQVFTAIDLEGKVDAILPAQLKPLDGAIVGGVRSLVQNQMERLMATEKWRNAVTKLAVISHKEAVKLLEGGGLGAGVTVANGEVTLNLIPLVTEGIRILQERGLLPKFEIPDLSAVPGSEAVAKLSKALGVQLPTGFGQIVVYRSETVSNAEAALATAQRAVALFFRAVTLIVVVTAVLVVAAIALSTHRRRTIIELAVGLVVAMVLARTATERALNAIPRLLVDPGARAAAQTVTVEMTAGLLRVTLALLVVGVAAAAIAWVPQLTRLGRPSGTPAEMLRSHGVLVATVLYGLAVLLLLVFGLYLVPLLLALVLVVAGIVLQLRSRAGASDGETTSGPQAAV